MNTAEKRPVKAAFEIKKGSRQLMTLSDPDRHRKRETFMVFGASSYVRVSVRLGQEC